MTVFRYDYHITRSNLLAKDVYITRDIVDHYTSNYYSLARERLFTHEVSIPSQNAHATTTESIPYRSQVYLTTSNYAASYEVSIREPYIPFNKHHLFMSNVSFQSPIHY